MATTLSASPAIPALDPRWAAVLGDDVAASHMAALSTFLDARAAAGATIYPPAPQRLRALDLTPPDRVRVVILGQDPYHGPGQAHGLAFSVAPGVKAPPSLANIFKERHADLGLDVPGHGCLEAWARAGVLLLNTVLTVEAGAAASHRGRGWERFTDAVIGHVAAGAAPVAFLLWGNHAQAKAGMIDAGRHLVIASAHPSPLSARHGFFGSRPFSRANAFLREHGRPPVDWALPPAPSQKD